MVDNNQFVYGNESHSSKKWLFLIIGFVLLLAIVLTVFFYVHNKSVDEQKDVVVKAYITRLKCWSSCPLSPIENPVNETTKYYFDGACMNFCNGQYKLSGGKYVNLDSALGSKINISDVQNFMKCFKLISIHNSTYKNCLNNFFIKYSNVIDLSNYTLPDYPKYSITITNLSCNTSLAKVDISLDQSSGSLKINLFALDVSGIAIAIEDLDAPALGETKEYSITNFSSANTNISAVGAAILLNGSDSFAPIVRHC